MTDIVALKAANAHRWSNMHLRADRISAFDATARRLCAPEAKARYAGVTARLRSVGYQPVPWWFIVGTSIMTYQAAMSSPLPWPMVNTPVAPTAKVAILLAVLSAGLFAMPDDASAQVKLKTPQQIVNDIKSATRQATSPTSSKPGACDITLFANLTVANVVTDIQNCIGSVVAGGAAPFVADIKAALQSATDAKDGTAVACLGPALSIATAAMGTPASADGSTPAVYPGPILIFQKYREFVTAGGPSNCKTAVQSTINGTMASAL